MTQKKADLLLLTVVLAWGSSNVMLKIGAEGIQGFNLIALRYGLGFLVTFLVFFKRCIKVKKKTLCYSALLGFILFAIGYVLIWALKLSTASEVSFLGSISVFFIPLICAVWRKQKPEPQVLIGMVVVLAGLLLLTNVGKDFSFSLGAALALLTSIINAFLVIVSNHASHQVDDTLPLGVFELGFAGLFGLIASFLLETPRLPNSQNEWISVLMLALVCSAYGFVTLAIGQKYTTPEHFGFINALEPVFSSILAFIILHEVLSLRGYIGALLIFISVLIANGLVGKKEKSYEKNH